MRLSLHRSFTKKYAKASPITQSRFKERRDLFIKESDHPLLHLHPLSGDRKGQWSINVTGDWRALFIYEDEQTIIFIDLDTHSNLYK